MTLEFAAGRREMQKSIKAEPSNVKYGNGGHSNKASTKFEEHKDECPAIWIFEEWQPQKLQDLKFIKS